MMIIGCDFHPSWQQVSWLDTETGETGELKLVQASGDAERFYRQVAAPALIGMEATGNCHWLVDLLSELGHELWVGDAARRDDLLKLTAMLDQQWRRPAHGCSGSSRRICCPAWLHSLCFRCTPLFRQRCCSSFFTRARMITSL